MVKFIKIKPQLGFSLVEVLLAVALLGIFSVILISGFITGQENSALAVARVQATQLAHEGLAAARSIRDNSFSALTVADHGIVVGGSGAWDFSGTSDATVLDGRTFTRQVAVTNVSTDLQQVVSTVTWAQNLQRNGSVSLTTYLSNWQGGTGGWADPSVVGSFELPKGNSGVAITRNGNTIALVRAAGSVDLAAVDITTPATPSYTTDVNITNTATSIAYFGNYALITTSSNSSEVLIYDLTNPAAPSSVTTVNLAGKADANDVVVSGNYAFITRSSSADPELVVLDLTTIGTPSVVGSLELADSAFKMSLVGSNLFIASANNTQELQIVNVATPATPGLLGSYDASGTSNAISVGAYGDYALIGFGGGDALLINVATPATPVLSGSFTAGGSVNDVIVYNDKAYLATSATSAEIQIVDLSVPATPTLLGSSDRANAMRDLIYDAGANYLIAISRNAPSELVILTASP